MTSKNPSRRKIVFSAALGNCLEVYDFALYGYFAPIIAVLFFPPNNNQFTALLATFLVFAIGFFMRPLGGLLFGYFGDRVGRKKTLAASIFVMAIPTALMGCLPTYAQIGAFAWILLLACRLLQGLAMGGEFVGSIVYITEQAPSNRRGLYGSFATASNFVGFLLGSGLSAFLASILSAEQLSLWGWRLPFIAGLALGFIGLYLRLNMPESPSFAALKLKHTLLKNPVATAFKSNLKSMILVFGLNFLPAASYYLSFVYLATYFTLYLKLSSAMALTINTLSILFLIVLTPSLAALSDKVGRKPFFILSALGFIFCSYPLFLILQKGGFYTILSVQLTFAFFVACLFSVMPATLVELVETKIRYTAIAFPFNLSSALFGSTMPLVATFLVHETGQLASPSLYLILAGLVMLLVMCFLKDGYKKVI
jgi:MHS family proline/betaine transporter-like MFS transporter